jgi:hypothetical protein
MRTTEPRQRDTIAKLEGDMDVWVATADDHENAHLGPYRSTGITRKSSWPPRREVGQPRMQRDQVKLD